MNISYPFSAWTSIEGKFIITTVLRAIQCADPICRSIDRFEFRFRMPNRSMLHGQRSRRAEQLWNVSRFDEKVKARILKFQSIAFFFEISNNRVIGRCGIFFNSYIDDVTIFIDGNRAALIWNCFSTKRHVIPRGIKKSTVLSFFREMRRIVWWFNLKIRNSETIVRGEERQGFSCKASCS